MKRPAKIMLIVLSAVVLAVLVIVANVVRSRSQVRGIEVVIRYGDTPQLVGSQTVVDTVLRSMPNLLQLSVKNVDCKRVASVARRVPFLTQVSASVSVGGKVVVRAGLCASIASTPKPRLSGNWLASSTTRTTTATSSTRYSSSATAT